MKKYVQISVAKKLKLLNEHCLGTEWKSLDQKKWCLHCGRDFTGHSVRVYKDEDPGLWLECGTPECDGSPIDWADYPWWAENHPATKGRKSARRRIDQITESGDPERN